LIKAKLGHRVDAAVKAVLPFLFRRRLDPNLLTVVGCVVSLGAAAAFALGHFAAGGLLILAGGVFDLVDGVIARAHGIATRFGAFLDSTLDRLTDMALLVGVAMYYALAGEPGHVLLAVGFLERAERVLILAAGALLGFMVPALWIVAVGSAITVGQRFLRAYQEMEKLDASERAAVQEQG
jgi:CDP-diacylglycerol--glycerol-3-phosphate 3-phosphatidyltransferase